MSGSGRVGCLSKVQTPAQVLLRPGSWIPGIRALHSHRETWIFEEPVKDAFSDIRQAIEGASNLQVRQVDEEALFIQAFSYTPRCSWLDVLEVQVDVTLTQSVTRVHVKGYSSGFLPVSVPLCFVWNAIFCWVPFSDGGANRRRIEALKESLTLNADIEIQGRYC